MPRLSVIAIVVVALLAAAVAGWSFAVERGGAQDRRGSRRLDRK